MMKNIQVPDKEQVSEESQELFGQLQKRLGKVPNLYATIGYSAHALKAFLQFEESLNHGAFNAKEREAIALVVSEVNGCNYCLAAHTVAALKRGFTQEETFLIRSGRASEQKMNTIVQLAKSIAENKGKPEEGTVEQFFSIGYTEAALMDLIGLVTVRIYTNYVYALTHIPVDFPAAQPLPYSLQE
ncbi:carboxymuconolactone decarboxylase family protein [Rhodocytophaga aerolata]|uniref:Carboxymuconolactone decarboxylase family protein n=1 Tax=Rhodocytophaga aerolata TaxID=455078 RepID=A0ABT8RFQ0_9BACT|nr:carboxymuconolactone decarboxylase family protein [Rhodocytophaga aerolata]MDO1450521.1 carboxymuconolactone decarboxylase family protein [Rhodocytophaga aerolata]